MQQQTSQPLNGMRIETDAITASLQALEHRVAELAARMEELIGSVSVATQPKEWYTTAEVAALMQVTRHTVQERWCNQGRIECEKDASTGKWRIPGYEYDRLRRGGRPSGI